MTRTQLAVTVVVVIAVIIGGAIVVLSSPTASFWRGNVPCSPNRKCKNPPPCILYAGCSGGRCLEQLVGDCAGSFYRDTTGEDGVTSVATCNTATCTWNEPTPCGASGQGCCGRGSCNEGLVCSKLTCRAP
jgi:hypothetical protein